MTKNLLIIFTVFVVSGLIAIGFIPGVRGYLEPLVVMSSVYAVGRGLILALLATLLVWSPPRDLWFRLILISGALIALTISVLLIATFALNFLDIMIFMLVAIIFAIEAMELELAANTRTKAIGS